MYSKIETTAWKRCVKKLHSENAIVIKKCKNECLYKSLLHFLSDLEITCGYYKMLCSCMDRYKVMALTGLITFLQLMSFVLSLEEAGNLRAKKQLSVFTVVRVSQGNIRLNKIGLPFCHSHIVLKLKLK